MDLSDSRQKLNTVFSRLWSTGKIHIYAAPKFDECNGNFHELYNQVITYYHRRSRFCFECVTKITLLVEKVEQ